MFKGFQPTEAPSVVSLLLLMFLFECEKSKWSRQSESQRNSRSLCDFPNKDPY